jgi:hypothetical protein
MEEALICPVCRNEHDQPGEARLGHLVVCLACALFDTEGSLVIEIEHIGASLAA